MSEKGYFKGVLSKVQISKFRLGLAAAVAVTGVFLSACGGSGTTSGTGGDPNEVAARVNGKDIKLEEVEKAIKAQSQGAEVNLSPLELASARLQVLEQLIQTELMFQRAEKEQTVPTDEEVTAEMNKRRTASNLSAEEFQKQMTAAVEPRVLAWVRVNRNSWTPRRANSSVARFSRPNNPIFTYMVWGTRKGRSGSSPGTGP